MLPLSLLQSSFLPFALVDSPRGLDRARSPTARHFDAVKQPYTRSAAIAVIADRTACSILTLFIVTATSRPLNKKSICCQSTDPTITADLRLQIRSPHTSSVCTCRRRSHRVTVHCTVSLLTNEPTPSLSPIDTYGVSSTCQFVFCGEFCG